MARKTPRNDSSRFYETSLLRQLVLKLVGAIPLIWVILTEVIGISRFQSNLDKQKSPPYDILVATWAISTAGCLLWLFLKLRELRLFRKNLYLTFFVHKHKKRLFTSGIRRNMRKLLRNRELIVEERQIKTLLFLTPLVISAVLLIIHAVLAAIAAEVDTQTYAIVATIPFTILLSVTVPFYVETMKRVSTRNDEYDSNLNRFLHEIAEYERESEPIWQFYEHTISNKWGILFQQWLYETDLQSRLRNDAEKFDTLLKKELGTYARSFKEQSKLVDASNISKNDAQGIVLTPQDHEVIQKLIAAQNLLVEMETFGRNEEQIANDPFNPAGFEKLLAVEQQKSSPDQNPADDSLISRRLNTWLLRHTLCRVEAAKNHSAYPEHKYFRLLLAIGAEHKWYRSTQHYPTWFYPTDENTHWIALNRLREFSTGLSNNSNNQSPIVVRPHVYQNTELTFNRIKELVERGVTRHIGPLRQRRQALVEACTSLGIEYQLFVEDADLFSDLFQRFTNEELQKLQATTTKSRLNDGERLLIRNIVYSLAFAFINNPEGLLTPRQFQFEVKEIRKKIQNQEVDERPKQKLNHIPQGHPAHQIRRLWMDIDRFLRDEIYENNETDKSPLVAIPLLAFELSHHRSPTQNWIRASNSVERRHSFSAFTTRLQTFQARYRLKSILSLPVKVSPDSISRLVAEFCELSNSSQNENHENLAPIRLTVTSLAAIEDHSFEQLLELFTRQGNL